MNTRTSAGGLHEQAAINAPKGHFTTLSTSRILHIHAVFIIVMFIVHNTIGYPQARGVTRQYSHVMDLKPCLL